MQPQDALAVRCAAALECHVDEVKAELLGAKNVKSTHIHVKTRGGVVSLTGSVPSAEDKTAAEEVVSNVSGVASVKNHLKIAAK